MSELHQSIYFSSDVSHGSVKTTSRGGFKSQGGVQVPISETTIVCTSYLHVNTGVGLRVEHSPPVVYNNPRNHWGKITPNDYDRTLERPLSEDVQCIQSRPAKAPPHLLKPPNDGRFLRLFTGTPKPRQIPNRFQTHPIE